MTNRYLLRIPILASRLLQFAYDNGITQEDETLGYTLHAWFTALFGQNAPKPFRYIEHRNEVLGYTVLPATSLSEYAQAFASPLAWAALDPESVVSKPMPNSWRHGQQIRMEVLTCPVSRKDEQEKDVYLRMLDKIGDQSPSRTEVYRDWFLRQWDGVVKFSRIDLVGMNSRSRLLRRSRNGNNRLLFVERPQALFTADAIIENGERFAEQISRGIGRHRAFGFGMVLLVPPR